MGGGDPPAFLLFERDQSGLSREHFDGNCQDARKQFLKIEFLGEGSGYFKQVVALSDAEIWEHKGFWKYCITATTMADPCGNLADCNHTVTFWNVKPSYL